MAFFSQIEFCESHYYALLKVHVKLESPDVTKMIPEQNRRNCETRSCVIDRCSHAEYCLGTITRMPSCVLKDIRVCSA